MRLIDATSARDSFEDNLAYMGSEVKRILNIAPTVDAELVHYGRWITINKGFDNWAECSECHTAGSPFWKRCPVCEAKMKGVGNNAVD